MLRKADGNTVTVPLAKLSAADRRFLQSQPAKPDQPKPFNAAQKQARERLLDTVQQLIKAEKGLSEEDRQDRSHRIHWLSTETLTACAGDPSMCLKDDYSAMNAYMIAAEVKFRLGESEAGKELPGAVAGGGGQA